MQEFAEKPLLQMALKKKCKGKDVAKHAVGLGGS